MENSEWHSLANFNKLSTSSFMMSVDTYAEQGNSAIWDPVQDIIKHKANIFSFFFFYPWIKLKQAFFTGNTEKFVSLAAAESVPAKSQCMNYTPNLSTSYFRRQTHSPRPGLQVFLLRVREVDHTSEGGDSQKMSSRACANFPNRPRPSSSCRKASKHLSSTGGQVLNIANTSVARSSCSDLIFFFF